jgi:ATP-dependent DNA helicase RecQ
VEKGATYKESLNLYLQGKNIQMIAAERGLSTTTIEGHLSRYIATGEINIHDFLTEEALTEIASHIKEDEAALQPLYAALNGKFSFGQLRMAMAHLKPHLQ